MYRRRRSGRRKSNCGFSMNQSGWALRWNEREAEGYTDYLSAGSLSAPSARITHQVIGPRGWRGIAACSVALNGPTVLLDYRPFASENTRAGMDVGLMTLVFSSSASKIIRVEWKYSGRPATVVDVTAAIGVPPSPGPYKPQKGKIPRLVDVPDRGAQGKFRIMVRASYGDRCTITGCDISEALDAVHIDPYENKSQHHVCNGLLLRKDLHALFDRSLIAVDPVSQLIHVAPTLRRYPAYRALHRKARLARPEPGYENHVPSQEALDRRWAMFRKESEL